MENTENQKLSKFLVAINSYAEQQKKQIHDEVEEFKAKELDIAEKEVLKESYLLIHKKMSQMRSEIRCDLANKEMEIKRALLNKRLDLTSKVFEQSKNKLIDYTKTNEYSQTLKDSANKLSKYLTADDIILYIAEKDIAYSKTIIDEFGKPCEIKTNDSIEIGGIKAISESLGVIADETLDAKLEAQHEWFIENCKLKVVDSD